MFFCTFSQMEHPDAYFMRKDIQKQCEQAEPVVTEQGDRLWPELLCPEWLSQHLLWARLFMILPFLSYWMLAILS